MANNKKTDMNALKEMASLFLYIAPTPTNLGFIIHHPYYETPFQACRTENGLGMVNIMESPENLKKAQEETERIINRCDTPKDIFLFIRRPYMLSLLKASVQSLSRQDFSEMLGMAWTMEEWPNTDENVSYRLARKYFKSADKKALMDDEEYEYFENLPPSLTIYRGVTKNKKGLSWTLDYDKAVWFATRYEYDTPYVLKTEISKNDVLAYFSRRYEAEIVADVDWDRVEEIEII